MTVSKLHQGWSLSTALLLFLVVPGPARSTAQEVELEKDRQIVTGFTGPFFDLGGEGDDGENELADGFEFEAGWAFGGSYQYFFSPRLSVEASFTFGTGEGELEGPGDDDPEDGDDEDDDDDDGNGDEDDEEGEVDGNGIFVTGALVYHFRHGGRIRPYVTAGAGLVRIDVGDRSSSRPAGIVGAGLLFGVTESLIVRVDARDHLYTLDQGGASTTRNDLALTGGVSLGF